MNDLDLHGVKHEDAYGKIVEYISRNPLPISIITGNSEEMKKFVYRAAEKFDLKAVYLDAVNLGRLTLIS